MKQPSPAKSRETTPKTKKKLTQSLDLLSWWFGVFVIVACLFLFVCLTFSHHLMIFLFSCVRTTILYSLYPSSAYRICIFFYYASHLSFLLCFVSICVGWLLAHLLDFWESLVVQTSLELSGWLWTDPPVFITQGLGLHLYSHPGCSHSCVSHTLLSFSSSWLADQLVGPGFCCCCCSFLNFSLSLSFHFRPKTDVYTPMK